MADVPEEPPEGLVHRGLGRVEFFDLSRVQMARLKATLGALAQEGRPRFSFHAPILRPPAFPYVGVACFFLSEDRTRRELSFRVVEETLAWARRWGADYVVTHLTFGPTDTADEKLACGLAFAAGARLAGLSRAYGMPLDIEFAAYSDGFHAPERFVEVVADYPELGLCLDIGHAFIGAKKRGRDYIVDIAALAPHARSLHLWNTGGPGARGHVPLHPSQRPAEGWIDVEQALAIALGARPEAHVIFEYPVDALSPAIQEGYDWVARVVERWRRPAVEKKDRTTTGKGR
jgi:sugar phosphate isomerase/epimerase